MTKSGVDFKSIPDSPGVYSFLKGSEVLYVGKATSLRDRVRSYFTNDLRETRSPLVARCIEEADRVTFEETDSVLDALILESKRIKELKPVGNTDQKDDKSYAYLAVTNDTIPRFLIFRGRELKARAPKKLKALYGPFLSASTLREALRIIRKIFPFYDTPFPIEKAKGGQLKTVVFNRSIGLYPQEEENYKRNVRNIMLMFDAKKKRLLRVLERDMHMAARKQQFELASSIKRQLFALKHIQDVTLLREELRQPDSTSFRIEAYDTAHLRGESARGVMVVIVDGEPIKDEYRIFSIREGTSGDDFSALQEIIERRAKHHEWPYPKLVVIDGGRTHLTRAKRIMAENGMGHIPAVSVVKNEYHKPKQVLGSSEYIYPHEKAILLANSEAHRFSIARHRRALRKRVGNRLSS